MLALKKHLQVEVNQTLPTINFQIFNRADLNTVDLTAIDNAISDERLITFISDMVDIASPTGEESELAKYLTQTLRGFGVEAEEQRIGDNQSNALGLLKGKTDAPGVLLYAPTDTVTCNSEAEDLPWIADSLRDDMRAEAFYRDGHVYGLGAHNPKGHGACILEAARILSKINRQLDLNIFFGFGAGGMPTNSRKGFPADTGHGVGCTHMIENMPSLSSAIIAKSGWSISSEEAGFIWMDVEVKGIHTYVGSRHLLKYENAIANASKLIIELENWFEERAEQHTTPLIQPQAVVSFIESGWERMPAFTPASARFRVDLRIGPDDSADEAEREFSRKLSELTKRLNVSASCSRVMTIDASRTPADSEVVTTTVAAWESITQSPHKPFAHMSGATDANILRQFGIPTARVGLAKASVPGIDFQLGMNCVAISDMRDLTKLLILSALNLGGSNG
jgi:succinyl-diaminopimelate desuccinylase